MPDRGLRFNVCAFGRRYSIESMLLIAALKRLSGEPLPLPALARSLGAAPDLVAAALAEAASQGVPLADEDGAYRLLFPLDWLDAEWIEARIREVGLRVQVAGVCGSTNVELMRAARAGAPAGQVLAAELQTQGRGRLGRAWHGGLCSGLCFSLLWRFEQPAAALGGLSLAVGVALARALEGFGIAAALKWPNDLLWQGRKLGGVLIEARADSESSCAVVVGVGMNVRLRAQERARIDQPVADLAEAGAVSHARSELLVAILRSLAQVLAAFAVEGFEGMRAEWDGYHAHAGRKVELQLPSGECVCGVARGVDESGRLLLATREGVRAMSAGDVSLRVRA